MTTTLLILAALFVGAFIHHWMSSPETEIYKGVPIPPTLEEKVGRILAKMEPGDMVLVGHDFHDTRDFTKWDGVREFKSQAEKLGYTLHLVEKEYSTRIWRKA